MFRPKRVAFYVFLTIALITTFDVVSADTTNVQVINLPETGQTTCYDELGTVVDCAGTGQDGEFHAGLAWPAPRFTDNGDGTVTDNLIGLVWFQDANCIVKEYPDFDNDETPGDGRVTWQHALDFVNGINDGTYEDCSAGHTDWRLSNINELQSLENDSVTDMNVWLNDQGFLNVQKTHYWSSTTQPSSSPVTGAMTNAYVILMSNGRMGGIRKDLTNVLWPVRGTSTGPSKEWKTGQTTCYDEAGEPIDCNNPTATGQDGQIQAGVAWPEPRFTANDGGTVVDNLTGLMYLQDINCIQAQYPSFDNDGNVGDGKVTWQHALDFVNGINDGTYASCGAGFDDWSLPNDNELSSLSDYENVRWLPHQAPFINFPVPFPGAPDKWWSSTSSAAFPSEAWFVSMFSFVSFEVKTRANYVLPVRTTTGQISGMVTTDDGATSIEEVTVLAEGVNTGKIEIALTAQDGTYLLDNLYTDTYTLTAIKPGYVTVKLTDIELAPEQHVMDVDFALQRGSTISGIVMKADGATPIAEATVLAIGPDGPAGAAVTLEDGTYEIERLIVQGTFEITIFKDGFGFPTQIVDISDSDQNITGIDFFAFGGNVVGTVTRADGNTPVAGAKVTAIVDASASLDINTQSLQVSTQTASDGSFELDSLLPTQYTLQVNSPGLGTANQTFVASNSVVEINFLLEPSGTVTGLVSDSAGQPLVGVKVRAMSQDDNVLILSDDGWTNQNGEYTIGGLSEGTYAIGVYLNDADFITEPNISVTAGQTTEVDLSTQILEEVIGGTIYQAENNLPIQSALIDVRSVTSRANGGTIITPADGNYVLYDMPAGPYVIEVQAQGFKFQSRIVDVVAGNSDRFDFYLESENDTLPGALARSSSSNSGLLDAKTCPPDACVFTKEAFLRAREIMLDIRDGIDITKEAMILTQKRIKSAAAAYKDALAELLACGSGFTVKEILCRFDARLQLLVTGETAALWTLVWAAEAAFLAGQITALATATEVYVGAAVALAGCVKFNPACVSPEECVDGKCEPTVVELIDFTANSSGRSVVLEWATATEINNAGFHIWRKGDGPKKLVRITKSLIPARGGGAWGAEYLFSDKDVHFGRTYEYMLEDVEFDGTSTLHDAVSVTVKGMSIIKRKGNNDVDSRLRDQIPMKADITDVH